MLDRQIFHRFMVSMLSAAVVGATLVDAPADAVAADGAGEDLGCDGFQQFGQFNRADGGFNEFQSCNPRAPTPPFNELIVTPIDGFDVPDIDIPDTFPEDPTNPVDPEPF